MIRFEIRLLMIFMIFFAGIAGLVLLIDMRTERQLVDDVDKDLKNIINTVHYSIQKLSAERGSDREVLERFIEEAKQNKAVREISVIGSTEEVIASSNPQKVGQRHALSGQEIVVREQIGSAKPSEHKIRYDIRVPLFRSDQVIGLVQTYVEVDDYRYLLRQLYLKNLLIAAGAMLFTFGAVFFVISRLNRPLRRLVSAADQVATGDLTVHIVPEHQDEVGRLTGSFNAMIQKLAEQRQLEAKLHVLERRAILAEMASNLAHEIRNPLNLINLTADHLSQQFQPEGQERQRSFRELISGLKTEVRQLNQTVNEFLNIGRPSKLKRSRFAWMDLFEEVERSIKSQLISKAITLKFLGQIELVINADREQMRLVVLNLLLNAVQAVSYKGQVTVHVERVNDAKEVVVSVTDNGPGIRPEDLHHIFEPYFTTRPSGTGLGLALVRRVIEEHGGKIHAVNVADGGARFEITLPVEG
jgi:nitrogen fixation/metabolism regulation signal transduction histidine kinase